MRLSEQYLPLARKHAQRYVEKYNGLYDYQDLEAVAALTLVEAERTYKPERGNGFAAYAIRAIQNRMNTYIGEEYQQSRIESLTLLQEGQESGVDFVEGEEFGGAQEWLQDEEDAFETIEFMETFKHFLTTVKRDEYFLIVYRMKHPDCTQAECAKALSKRFEKKYSQVTVFNMLKRTQSKYLLYQECEEVAA